ncbi:MAG: hypothetical protein R8G66_19845 [Cytophagales bacterium]|nr:hypothetical protein [Cytophagales bacterium]
MKYLSVFLLFLIACSTPSKPPEEKDLRNEVLVFGMIHSGHLTQPEFGIDVLTAFIKEIDPDIILTEIPPDRFPIAMKEFKETDSIQEPRVIRFPEYIDVVFPLSKEMDFEIIPTAGWTRPMADARSKKLREISQDPERAEDWARYRKAGQLSDSLMELTGMRYDPYWINSTVYDSLAEIRLSVYNELFNEELGDGGWDNINEAHYSYIAQALDAYTNQGKRVVITYGAGHKGWFLRALKKRNDIRLLNLEEVVPQDRLKQLLGFD